MLAVPRLAALAAVFVLLVAIRAAAADPITVVDFIGLRVDRWLTPAAAGCSLGTGICTFSPGIALNPGLGLWEVIAWNPTGYSSWSAPVFFFAP